MWRKPISKTIRAAEKVKKEARASLPVQPIWEGAPNSTTSRALRQQSQKQLQLQNWIPLPESTDLINASAQQLHWFRHFICLSFPSTNLTISFIKHL
ncbi:hypothetical protein MJO28_016207 [Puccinia striiformis f. sp. tritici]|uniref:Uncharacterized protein n=1 Tax=Puccinia striiformis f. sp. tritici TaxID=168172 RepID=A0ACC0DNH0_9BASI|nr:hypothetical protein MJO29_016419 [Puccinia striiformis f. sp. tritici]KAI7935336.1 hypothetical protein MJO28_016207 [Puccinia striiformis f. sp. tritici]